MKNRLFTFGCSYTLYNWPTWADLLGLEYPIFFNWGYAGLGNRAIAERLAEAHARFNINESDTVIIQWSSPLRHDWMHFGKGGDDLTNWRTHGSIFSKENSKIFKYDWIEQFWDEKAYFIHMFNHMVLAQQLLESTGCKWWMTSMYDVTKATSDISIENMGGEDFDSRNNQNTIWKLDPSLDFYREQIFEKYQDKWIDPITWVQYETQDLIWLFPYDKKEDKEKSGRLIDGDMWMEPHPSIQQYSIWLLLLKEKMGLPVNLTVDQISLISEISFLKNESTGYKDFENKIRKSSWYLSVAPRGF